MPKRALLCLLLLVVHLGIAGCDTAGVGVAVLDDVDDDVGEGRRVYARPSPVLEDDDDEADTDTATIPRRGNKSIAPKTPCLRKNAASAKKKGAGRDIFAKAFDRAIGGGIPGAVAGVIQGLALMWLVG